MRSLCVNQKGFTRRHYGGLARRLSCPPSSWRSDGVADLPAVIMDDCPEFFGEEVIVARIEIWAQIRTKVHF